MKPLFKFSGYKSLRLNSVIVSFFQEIGITLCYSEVISKEERRINKATEFFLLKSLKIWWCIIVIQSMFYNFAQIQRMQEAKESDYSLVSSSQFIAAFTCSLLSFHGFPSFLLCFWLQYTNKADFVVSIVLKWNGLNILLWDIWKQTIYDDFIADFH